MHAQDCTSLYKTNAKVFADRISQAAPASPNHPLNQLTLCLRRELIYWAVIAYKTQYPDISFIEFTADIAVSEAILRLQDEALAGRITDKGATIKTLVFAYFKIKLQELLQQEARRNRKETGFKKHVTLTTDVVSDAPPVEAQLEYKVLMKAIERLRKKDQQIILRRHLLQEKPEQIAAQLKMTTLSVNNKLYRAMKRLKEQIAKLAADGTDD